MTDEMMAYLARERAMMMTRADWQAGLIDASAMEAQARRYESYLVGEAVMALATQLPDSESREDSPPCSSSAVVGHLGGTRSAPSGER
jgi:hypothetical protein